MVPNVDSNSEGTTAARGQEKLSEQLAACAPSMVCNVCEQTTDLGSDPVVAGRIATFVAAHRHPGSPLSVYATLPRPQD